MGEEPLPQDDLVLDAIVRTFVRDGHPARIVVRYVLVAEWIDADGDRGYWTDTAVDQRAHETLGILEMASTIERERIVRWHFDDEDGGR